MSWVSLPDLVNAVLYLISTLQFAGPVNVVSPAPVTNAEFTQTLAHVLRRPAAFPVPVFALRTVLGEMADEALLASTRALPERLTQAGFSFRQEQLAAALELT
jgi:NAD dependent epimerase/dehydratase family enzyme